LKTSLLIEELIVSSFLINHPLLIVGYIPLPPLPAPYESSWFRSYIILSKAYGVLRLKR
jgi:hypothetical protein